VILLALLLATATPLERDPAYRQAEAAYNDFEFEDARLRFEKLARRRGLGEPERARLQVWIGMCHAEEGALDAAASDFEEAATIDADVEALPFMSPKARRMLEDARKRAMAKRTPTRPEPLPDPEPAPAAAPAPAPAPVDAGLSPLLIGGAAVLGVGGVAAVSATIAGVAAQAAAAEAVALDDADAAAARHEAAQQLALGANIGFGAAAVAAVAGVGMLFLGVTTGD
jgi:hypothetical protein